MTLWGRALCPQPAVPSAPLWDIACAFSSVPPIGAGRCLCPRPIAWLTGKCNEDLGTILEIINGRAKLKTVATMDLKWHHALLTDALVVVFLSPTLKKKYCVCVCPV